MHIFSTCAETRQKAKPLWLLKRLAIIQYLWLSAEGGSGILAHVPPFGFGITPTNYVKSQGIQGVWETIKLQLLLILLPATHSSLTKRDLPSQKSSDIST